MTLGSDGATSIATMAPTSKNPSETADDAKFLGLLRYGMQNFDAGAEGGRKRSANQSAEPAYGDCFGGDIERFAMLAVAKHLDGDSDKDAGRPAPLEHRARCGHSELSNPPDCPHRSM